MRGAAGLDALLDLLVARQVKEPAIAPAPTPLLLLPGSRL